MSSKRNSAEFKEVSLKFQGYDLSFIGYKVIALQAQLTASDETV